MNWFGKRGKVLCINCIHVSRPERAGLDVYYCRAVSRKDCVTGEMKYRLCIMQNCDGHCRLFKGREPK
jgi:hypothetical protein